MKLSRRALLKASLGAGQLYLLDRFGLLRDARADVSDGPTRLLVLYLQGGARFQTFFCPFTPEDHTRLIPPPASANGEPVFFTPADLVALGPQNGPYEPLRIGKLWKDGDPGDRAGYTKTPMGYSWLHYGLGPSTVALHGVDQGSFAHGSAYVSAMCGVAGESYRAPALVSVIANHMHARFADTRPLPCVAIRAQGAPSPLSLPAQAAPAIVPDLDVMTTIFSGDGGRRPGWKDHDARTKVEVPPLQGGGAPTTVALTDLDAYVLERTRTLAGRSSAGNDAVLAQIYDGYTAVSRTLSQDLVTAVEKVTPVAQARPDHLRAFGFFDFTFGLANGRIVMKDPFEWALRILKSGISTSVYAFLPEVYYDAHNGSSWPRMTASLRAQLDMVAQLLGELKATPSPDRPGKTLHDDTLVLVTSEFGRTFASGPDQKSTTGWSFGDDHNALLSLVLSGGGIDGNRQIGGYEAVGTRGRPVAITEESGAAVMRPPRSADVMATVCRAFRMTAGKDFFLPGGYGEISGVVRQT